MSALDKRLTALEQRSTLHGPLVVLTVDADATADEEARGLAEAEQAAGPNGLVLHVRYDAAPRPDWWGPEQDALMADKQPRPPYELSVNDDWRGR